MKRLIVKTFTGAVADDLRIARRVARKIKGAQNQGICVLVDCEDVVPSQAFLDVLIKDAHPDKVRFCGLPISRQFIIPIHPLGNVLPHSEDT
jgi:hypothetical protein